MAGEVKSFDEPDEVVTLPLLEVRGVTFGEVYVARVVHQPGWRWSTHVKPTVGGESCRHHHQGIVLSGAFEFVSDDGARRRLRAGHAYDIPPGHDGWVVGDEPCVVFEFAGVRGWGKPPETGERVLATLVVTDIVDSTATAARLGDTRWKDALGRHFDRVRVELDRFRGFEVTTTGDGFVAMFDGPSRAVRCASALTRTAERDGLRIRAGVHTGEIERQGGNVRGVAIHAATRVASAAAPGEVIVSSTAAALLEGSGLELDDAGEHELKGLPGRRRLYRLVA